MYIGRNGCVVVQKTEFAVLRVKACLTFRDKKVTSSIESSFSEVLSSVAHLYRSSRNKVNVTRVKMFERSVPVLRSDFNLIDDEFSSVRGRFEAEMRKMEEEMNKFRSSLMDRERDFFGSSTTTSSQQRTTTSHTTSTDYDGNTRHRSELTTWLDGLNSPLVQDADDGKVLKLRFDVTQYAPEEIVVKTVDNRLQVHAKHEEKTENKSVYREYNREFMLPKGVNPELIRSSLSRDGVLTVEAPLPAIDGPRERHVPIAQR